MRHRVEFRREIRIQPRGVLGCLLALVALGGMVVLAVFLLLPLLGIALGVALGLVALGAMAVTYYRLRAWWRRLRGRGDATYEAEVLGQQEGDDPPRPQKRLTVHGRRSRPPEN